MASPHFFLLMRRACLLASCALVVTSCAPSGVREAPSGAAAAPDTVAQAAATDAEHFRSSLAPGAQRDARWARADWRDPSPHRDGFVDAGGQRLQYLDWGGTGQPLVFLPGMGHTAHIFDELAPRFTDRYHVVSLTMRGHGASTAPTYPYTVDSLATDTRAALAALGLRDVVLAGHSLGGHVANRVAALYPGAVSRVIYLDAAKDSIGLAAVRAAAPTKRPSVPDSVWRTQAGVRATLRRLMFNFWSDAQEADFRAQRTSPQVAAMADLYALQDWRSVQQPQLDVCALDTTAAQFPWLDSAARAALDTSIARYVTDHFVPWERAACERFAREAPRGTLVVVPQSNHYVFLVSPEQTYQAMRRWLEPVP